jgi:hypothetical protein
MSLALYNTLTRRKESFEPLVPGQVKMYCCGVTVYDYCHLGHARSYIVWDTVRRYLTWRGFQVRYVQNFTDIDDKILNRAKQEGGTMQTVADRYTQAYFEDMARLNILEADQYTYATHTLDGIQQLITELEQKGMAYPAGGDVYYAVRKFDGYGKLSGRKLDDMQAGASGRVATGMRLSPKSKIPLILPCGKGRSRGNRPGSPLGGQGGRVGILNVPPWCGSSWGTPSTFTWAGPTSCFPTMRTKLPSRRRQRVTPWPPTGCTTAW